MNPLRLYYHPTLADAWLVPVWTAHPASELQPYIAVYYPSLVAKLVHLAYAQDPVIHLPAADEERIQQKAAITIAQHQAAAAPPPKH